MGLVLRFHLGDDRYLRNALVKCRDEKVYIKILNTQDTDEIIVPFEAELEEQDKIASSLKKFQSLRQRCRDMC